MLADDMMQADSVFSGITTFGRLPYQPCLQNPDAIYDIAFIGRQAPSPNP
jgi:agmatinase